MRHTDTQNNRDENDRILPDCVAIRTDHLRDFSTNLLGVFTVDDISWQLQESDKKNYFLELWCPGTDVEKPAFPAEISYNRLRGCFFIKIGDIHDVQVDYDDITKTRTVCEVVHTPTNYNYWHFSVKWFFNGKELLTWSKGVKRRMKTAAKGLIIEKGFFTEPTYYSLEPDKYLIQKAV